MPAPRLYAHLARSKPVGVVLRRGPSRLVELVLWDLKTDTFTRGQWFKGRIYERRCDLSPDGTLFGYFAAKHVRPHYSWTGISRPPYLTALAMWPKGDCWDGGGLFDSEHRFALNGPHHELLDGLRLGITCVHSNDARGEDAPIENDRMTRDGWTLLQPLIARFGWKFFDRPQQAEIYEKSFKGVVLQRRQWYESYLQKVEVYDLLGCDADLSGAEWADWDANGRLLLARGGSIWSIDDVMSPVVREAVNLSEDRYCEVGCPEWARQWP